MKKVFVILALLSLVGCIKKVPVHPGSISNLDSYAFDVLIVEQEAINTARAQFIGNELPAAAKDPLNAAIDQYNVTQTAWQAYHATGKGEVALQQALTSLIAAVGELNKVLQKKPLPVVPASGSFDLSQGVIWVS